MMVARLLAVVILMLALPAAPLAADAQQSAKVPRIGMLGAFSPEHPEGRAIVDVFRQALSELGYEVDLIVAPNTPFAVAVKQAMRWASANQLTEVTHGRRSTRSHGGEYPRPS